HTPYHPFSRAEESDQGHLGMEVSEGDSLSGTNPRSYRESTSHHGVPGSNRHGNQGNSVRYPQDPGNRAGVTPAITQHGTGKTVGGTYVDCQLRKAHSPPGAVHLRSVSIPGRGTTRRYSQHSRFHAAWTIQT